MFLLCYCSNDQADSMDFSFFAVVVPTATMVQEETCFDTTKQPFPVSYAQQRRMAQRFDQSLIMECTLMDIQDGL